MSQYQFQVGQGMFKSTNFAVLTITAVSQTLASYDVKTIRAMITVEGSNARYRYDGGTPTSSTGHLITSGDVIQVLGPTNISSFQCVSLGTTNLMITYEGDRR